MEGQSEKSVSEMTPASVNKYKIGDQFPRVQLCSSTPMLHHRTTLSILNRVVEAKLPVMVSLAQSILLPTQENSTDLNIVRKDFVTMVFGKAQDEEIFVKQFVALLRAVHLRVDEEAEDGCAVESLVSLVRSGCIEKVESLYRTLEELYTCRTTWTDELDQLTRRRLGTMVRMSVLLYYSSLLEWQHLDHIREMISSPLTTEGADVGTSDALSSPSLKALSAEMVAICLCHFGDLNNMDIGRNRDQVERLCGILREMMPQLSNRQRFIIMKSLDLQAVGWRKFKVPQRCG